MAGLAAIVVLCVSCSASTDDGDRSDVTTTPETSATVPTEGTSGPLEAHLATIFTAMFAANAADDLGEAPESVGRCVAGEFIEHEGGVSALERAGVTTESTQADVTGWLDAMTIQRVTGGDPEPFDGFVDATWACGWDDLYASEFRQMLQRNGNDEAATECLVSKVIGDREMRLVLVVGNRAGTDPNPDDPFTSALVAKVDEAAAACGVAAWGGG